jgi:hypothetical protein
MAVRRVTAVTVPVDGWSGVVLDSFPARSPLLTILTARPSLLVTLTLPEHVESGHVRFARTLAASAAEYAAEVERKWRGGSPLAARAAT